MKSRTVTDSIRALSSGHKILLIENNIIGYSKKGVEDT